jgi:aldose 1-epimerase
MNQPGITAFGVTQDGKAVQRITLRAGELTVALLTWGAVLQSLRLLGVPHDLTLGSDRLADYEGGMRYHGSLIGPVVNRITGATALIDGAPHRFEVNQDPGITLHSGAAGTHLKIWQIAEVTENAATLTLTLADGEGGFPGTRRISARFSLIEPATLRLTVTVFSTATTLINIANHSYWNLDGSADWTGHSLQIHADRFLPTTAHFTPTGQISPVAGSDMDFRQPRRIAAQKNLFDTNFCLSDQRRAITDALTLTGTSGVSMTMATTEPGLQVYDGRNAIRPGRAPYEALAFEAQFWPDAPNHPAFPDITLAAGTLSEQVTEWRFRAS